MFVLFTNNQINIMFVDSYNDRNYHNIRNNNESTINPTTIPTQKHSNVRNQTEQNDERHFH